MTSTNLIVPIIADDGEEIQFYVPQPNEEELIRISRVLSYIFNETTNNGSDARIIIVDHQRLVEESLMSLSSAVADNVKKQLNSFYERSFAGAVSNSKAVEQLSAEEKEMLKGSLLFISALYRYAYKGAKIKSNELKAFFTHSTASEWLKSTEKQSTESTEAPQGVKVEVSQSS